MYNCIVRVNNYSPPGSLGEYDFMEWCIPDNQLKHFCSFMCLCGYDLIVDPI